MGRAASRRLIYIPAQGRLKFLTSSVFNFRALWPALFVNWLIETDELTDQVPKDLPGKEAPGLLVTYFFIRSFLQSSMICECLRPVLGVGPSDNSSSLLLILQHPVRTSHQVQLQPYSLKSPLSLRHVYNPGRFFPGQQQLHSKLHHSTRFLPLIEIDHRPKQISWESNRLMNPHFE